ncbi:MAG TPA: CGGC domain-containing protein [Anaerohalosphaeraceae bacterium]|nr:CGGC domain-containing protein [Anaerohalosphaeraceae bacterium]
MIDLASKDYLVIVQCEIVKQRCPGYLCEKAWHERTGGFAAYPKDKAYRVIHLTCGGCCGRGLHRKLTLLNRTIKKKENIEKDKIIVQLSSCITKDNYHAPPCPHRDYIRALVSKIGMDYLEDTVISRTAQRRREEGIYSE